MNYNPILIRKGLLLISYQLPCISLSAKELLFNQKEYIKIWLYVDYVVVDDVLRKDNLASMGTIFEKKNAWIIFGFKQICRVH